MDRDEVYVPKTRSDLGIPTTEDKEIHWDEIFGDTPIYTLYMLLRQQFLAFPAYLCKCLCEAKPFDVALMMIFTIVFNVSGQKSYPKPTSHFDRKRPFRHLNISLDHVTQSDHPQQTLSCSKRVSVTS